MQTYIYFNCKSIAQARRSGLKGVNNYYHYDKVTEAEGRQYIKDLEEGTGEPYNVVRL